MSKLQVLSVYLTERLTLAAQEIFKAVEDAFSEYNEEICRSRQEIELLKRRLLQAGVQMDSETQPSFSETPGPKCIQAFSEEWRSDSEHDLKDSEMHMKLEVYTQHEENEVQMPVCNESGSSFSPCVDIYHNKTHSKDTETQIMDDGENHNFTFINQAAHIKNEPEINTEMGTTCQAYQQIAREDLNDSRTSDDSYDTNKIKVSHIGSPRHKMQTFNMPHRNQEISTPDRMDLAQIRERMSLRIRLCNSERKSRKSQSSVCQDGVSKSDKRKASSARRSQTWRDRLKEDPVKFAEFKASEAARAREYRRKMTAAAVEIAKEKNRERQRRCRLQRKLQQFKADQGPLPLYKRTFFPNKREDEEWRF
nr:uncharacterized protein LOC558435 isoform X3 [Danio rerio]|eukprot:XP_005172937.1 uncharacterized protein LOC558435 isoform X3 [Danio rerio]